MPPTPAAGAPDAAPAVQPELLEHLAEVLVAGLDAGPEPEPTVAAVGVLDAPREPSQPEGSDHSFTLAVRPLDGPDPVATLLGFTAPHDWQAMGVVATGRCFGLTDHEADTGTVARHRGREPRGRARLAHVVARTGEAVGAISVDGAEPTVTWLPPGAWYGRSDDVCRRALGLPTAEPARDPGELWALVWCDVLFEQLLQQTAGRRQPLSWDDVAAAHPAIGKLGLLEPDARRWAVGNLERLGQQFARMHSWDHLRTMCAGAEWPVTGVRADDAAWMDAGMFSRWVLEPYPELAELADHLGSLLPAPLAHRFRRTLAAWGLP